MVKAAATAALIGMTPVPRLPAPAMPATAGHAMPSPAASPLFAVLEPVPRPIAPAAADGPVETPKSSFTLDTPAGPAVLDYKFLRDGSMLVIHTGVPEAARGQGHAARLAELAIAEARARGIKINPLCGYMAAYMRKRPELHDMLHPQARARVLGA